MAVTRTGLIQAIQNLEEKRRRVRAEERSLKGKEKYLNQMPVIANNDLKSNLSSVLPSRLVPTNLGSIKHILQPYWYEVAFDLGSDITLEPTFRREENFQVSQESAFLLTSISRAYKDVGSAGLGLPLQLDIRDNQSTRQFNDNPISIQNFGYKSSPTELDVPLLLMPNASVRITLSTWLAQSQDFVGDSYTEFAFGGFRVPVEDVEYVLDQLVI